MKNIVIFVLSSLICSSALASDLPTFPFVSVVGTSEKKVSPDRVNVSLQSLVFDMSSDVAMTKNTETMTSVFTILTRYGISGDSIEASDVRKREKRAKDDDYQSLNILGYEVSRNLSFQLKDLSRYSDLVNELNAIDFVTDVNAQFDTAEREHIERQLLQEASRESRQKADILAAGLDAKIDSVFGISQDRDFSYGVTRFHYRQSGMHAMMADSSRIGTMSLFIPKNITLTQTLNVLYRLK